MEHEGGYVNNPKDPGGETNFGITKTTARAEGYMGSMKNMTLDTAKQIYRKKYWNPIFDEIPFALAFQLFDVAVNSGQQRAVQWLQTILDQPPTTKITDDTKQIILNSDISKLVLLFNAHRLEYLTNLKIWDTFGKGWTRRIISNLRLAANEK
jgi:lysozyme family protein